MTRHSASFLRIETECNFEDCSRVFFATKATLIVSDLDIETGAISATIMNLEAEEIVVVGNGEDPLTTTRVVDGHSFCVSEIEFTPECKKSVDCTDVSKSICERGTCVECLDFNCF